ncbi:hypothetical protein G6L16_018625 [Agrobacterium tumefaciens]|uniref:hypothetical protein n=1 Tax=Agrobacterium tumefaciens TaxID=358 RepID=UPI0015728C72|nr:hypothetical protein [Agrobacterium tumefaciens]NSZ65168.1 hypothetical protein [Agrobacterium tumefaciens]NTA71539.1 hypothetical protein [Agrobacterium tumefaciens]WIE40231.1 hypothetical protein G6L16_018625 [Agrobacterium tumefaciens]
MRMKINQKTADGASAAVDRVWEIVKDSEFLEGDTYNAATSASILENSVEQMFRGCEAGKFLKDERLDGYYLISADERRYLTFQVDDTARRCRALEELANNLSSKLFELRDWMKQAGDLNDTQPSAE